MNEAEIRERVVECYCALTLPNQERFLANVGHWLTMAGRGTYVVGEDDVHDGPTLRKVNEGAHRIFDQLRLMLMLSDQRYPDDVFAEILVDKFQAAKLDPQTLLKFFDQRS